MTASQHPDSSARDGAGEEALPVASRRRVVGAAGLAAVGAVGLSACGSGSGGGSPAADTPAAPSTPTDVAAAADIPVGTGVKVDKDGLQAVVAQPSKGTFTAFSPVCPHQGCQVNPSGDSYVCPCHSSVFDMRNGDVTAGPAATGLTSYPVSVRNGRVVVG